MDKNKKVFYVFLSILSAVMLILAILSFVFGEPKYIISNGIIFVFATIAILLVFDSVESLNIGNVISLKAKVKEKEKEVDRLSAENVQLRNQFLSVMNTTFSNKSSSQVFVGVNPKDYIVQQADKQDTEDEASTMDNEITSPPVSETHSPKVNYVNRRIMTKLLDELLLSRFKKENNISDSQLCNEVKIKNLGNSTDPIIEKDIVYDAYLKRPIDEIFIEISSYVGPHSLFDYRLYFMISRVYYYSQANKVKAKMIIVLPKYSESYLKKNSEQLRIYDHDRYVQKLKEMYAPAIQNDLLEVVEISVSDGEMEQIEKEAFK